MKLSVLLVSVLLTPAFGWSAPEFDLQGFPVALQKTIFYEQKLIGIRDTSHDTLNPSYQPEAGQIFAVPTFWVDRDLYEIRVDEASMPASLKSVLFRRHNGKEQILVSVHPEGFDYYPQIISQAESGEPLISAASASPRSLITFTVNDQGKKIGFYNKLSLNKRLGGNIRLIHVQELARSYFVTQLLSQEKKLPTSFTYYPEFLVMIPKGGTAGGTILRSIPEEVVEGQVSHIPFFALYAPMPDGTKPLIVRMAEQARMPVDEYFQKKMVEPFLKQWMDLALDHGISMEPHGQNLLLEVSADGQPTGRFVHRDFGGFTIALAYRKKLGLQTPELPTLNGYTVNYNEGDVGYGFKSSLDLYFANIVDNFAHRYQDWEKAGWVTKAKSVDQFHLDLFSATEKAYESKTGLKLDLRNHLVNLMEPMFEAQRKRLSESQIQTAQSCRSML